MLNYPHACPDWDFLEIHPGDVEMTCCTCELTEDFQMAAGNKESIDLLKNKVQIERESVILLREILLATRTGNWWRMVTFILLLTYILAFFGLAFGVLEPITTVLKP